MKFQQNWTPSYPHCTTCGRECKEETCPGRCGVVLQKVRNTIANQIIIEQELDGLRPKWNSRAINVFNDLQETIAE